MLMYEIAVALAAVAIAFAVGAPALSRLAIRGVDSVAAVLSGALVDLTNAERSAHSLSLLRIDPLLTQAAQAKADDMAAKGYFSHVSLDGITPWHWISQAGYDFETAGENLAIDFFDSADVEAAWMASPTHRANIMNAGFTEIGIATAEGVYDGHPTTFVVQMFGRPAGRGSISGGEPVTVTLDSDELMVGVK